MGWLRLVGSLKVCLFCKRALQKRLYSAKETYDFKEPTYRSHPIPTSIASKRAGGFGLGGGGKEREQEIEKEKEKEHAKDRGRKRRNTRGRRWGGARKREREKERESVCVCVCERKG